MKFSIPQVSLKKTIDKIVGVIPSKPTVPALSYVKLKIDGDTTKAIATDLNAWLLTMARCNSDGEAEILAPGKKLQEIVNLFPEEEVFFELKDKKVNLKCGNVKHQIAVIDPTYYPKEQCLLKEDGYVAMPRNELQYGIDAVAFAVSKNYSPISGILFDLKKGKLKLAATDGHRLGI